MGKCVGKTAIKKGQAKGVKACPIPNRRANTEKPNKCAMCKLQVVLVYIDLYCKRVIIHDPRKRPVPVVVSVRPEFQILKFRRRTDFVLVLESVTAR